MKEKEKEKKRTEKQKIPDKYGDEGIKQNTY